MPRILLIYNKYGLLNFGVYLHPIIFNSLNKSLSSFGHFYVNDVHAYCLFRAAYNCTNRLKSLT